MGDVVGKAYGRLTAVPSYSPSFDVGRRKICFFMQGEHLMLYESE